MTTKKPTGPKGPASKNADSVKAEAGEIARLKAAHQVEIDLLKADRLAEMRAKVSAQVKVFKASVNKSDQARSQRVGGKKGAATRRQASKIPSPDVLRTQRENLIANGTAPRDTASKLATRYGVTSRAIRDKLNKKEVK